MGAYSGSREETQLEPSRGPLVLITGGAGFLGINLVRYLRPKGYRLRVLDKVRFDYPDSADVEIVLGDIRKESDVVRAMRGVDIVVHTAAALPLYSEEDIHSTDIDGTYNVLEAASQAGVPRVVHISSTAVYGIPDHHPLVEGDKLEGVGPYGIAKIMAEEACQEYRTQGLVVPILRPKSFIGPERLGVFAIFYEWAVEGHSFPMIGYGHNRYQLLDVEDLCQAIWLCMTLPDGVVNDTFNIGSSQYTTMREDQQAVLDAAGFGRKIIGFPETPIIWLLRLLDFFGVSPIYKWVYETAGKDSFVSIEKAQQQLGFAPQHSSRDALLRNFRWYQDHAAKLKGQTGVSHRVPWKQGVLGLMKVFF